MAGASRKLNNENQEWAEAAESAKEIAASLSAMAGHAASAVGAMAGHATGDLGKKVDALAAEAGVGIQELGDKLSKRAPQSGVLGSASQAVAKSVRQGGEYLEEAKLSGVTEDVAQLIRRHPISSVLIAVGLGCYLARKFQD